MDSFDSIPFRHVYMEFNMDTYKLCKEGLQLEPGQQMIAENVEGEHFAYYHMPFIDPLDHFVEAS